MSDAADSELTCSKCGAVVLPEHLENHSAIRHQGRLFCPHCVRRLRERAAERGAASEPANAPDTDKPVEDGVIHVPEEAIRSDSDRALEMTDIPVALVEDDDRPRVVGGPSSRIHGFSGTEMTGKAHDRQYNRALLKGSPNATRCKTFHCKITDASIVHLNEQINEWVDEREDVEIKFVQSNVGVLEGKHSDPHLIVTIFY